MGLKINHLQHVGIPVTSLQASKAFYTRLGFEDVMRASFRHHGEEGNVCMMRLGSVIMELYQMPESALAEIRQRGNGHIDHVAFDVDDIDQTFNWLKQAGFEVLEEQPVFLDFWTKGCKYCYILGPDGERLEFCQIL